jgi:hypothetical protein
VDEIVRELSNEERIGALYKEWCAVQDKILGTYKDKRADYSPLWEQKAFKSIKNAVISKVASRYDDRIFIDESTATSAFAGGGSPYALKMPNFIQSEGQGQANASAVTLLYHLSRMIRDNCNAEQAKHVQTDKKLTRKIAQLKESHGQRMD